MFAGIAGFVERMIFMLFLFVPTIEAITAAAAAFIGGAALGQRVCDAVEPSRREHFRREHSRREPSRREHP